MKSIEVKVCVCTQCVMNGAMDIVDSIESLQKLKSQLRFNATVKIVANECICEATEHGSRSPLVVINGDVMEHATAETVAEKIISMLVRK